MTEPPAILFREDQRIRQPMLWIILILGASFAIGTAVFFLRRGLGDEETFAQVSPWTWVLLVLLVIVPVSLTLILFGIAKLQTEVNTHGLFLRYIPFHRKVRQIDLNDVIQVKAVQYHAVKEYGGYGIRILPRAKAYNAGGSQGVRIHYANGCHLLIGTAHPEALEEAILRVLPTQEPHPEYEQPADWPEEA